MPPGPRRCLECGMLVEADELVGRTPHCPKCDNNLATQHDGSTRVVDIAHQGETISEAFRRLDDEIATTRASHARYLLVIVGQGRIRDEIEGELAYRARSKAITGYQSEPHNPGAFRIQLK